MSLQYLRGSRTRATTGLTEAEAWSPSTPDGIELMVKLEECCKKLEDAHLKCVDDDDDNTTSDRVLDLIEQANGMAIKIKGKVAANKDQDSSKANTSTTTASATTAAATTAA
eukprot:scpid105659/ scgid2337/ 